MRQSDALVFYCFRVVVRAEGLAGLLHDPAALVYCRYSYWQEKALEVQVLAACGLFCHSLMVMDLTLH